MSGSGRVMRASLTTPRLKHNVSSLHPLSCRAKSRDPADVRFRLFFYWQAGGFPSFEATRHRADVFVPHLLQVLGGKCGASASAAMTNDHCVKVRDFFFDIEFDSAATHVNCVGNMSLVPFIFLANIDDHRFTAL